MVSQRNSETSVVSGNNTAPVSVASRQSSHASGSQRGSTRSYGSSRVAGDEDEDEDENDSNVDLESGSGSEDISDEEADETEDEKKSGGLSVGAIAGIAAAGVVALLGAGFSYRWYQSHLIQMESLQMETATVQAEADRVNPTNEREIRRFIDDKLSTGKSPKAVCGGVLPKAIEWVNMAQSQEHVNASYTFFTKMCGKHLSNSQKKELEAAKEAVVRTQVERAGLLAEKLTAIVKAARDSHEGLKTPESFSKLFDAVGGQKLALDSAALRAFHALVADDIENAFASASSETEVQALNKALTENYFRRTNPLAEKRIAEINGSSAL